MKFYEILMKSLLIFPNWVIKTILSFLTIFVKKKIKNIEIKEKSKTTSLNNLIVIDNMRAIGDFFILLKKIIHLDSFDSQYKYYVYCNSKFESIIKNINFKNISFIFSPCDFGGHFDINKQKTNDYVKISKEISKKILNVSDNWNNIFICCSRIDLNHYSILNLINYNKAFVLKNFWSKKYKIINQNIPVPSINMWLWFFKNSKKYNFEVYEKVNCLFGDIVLQMIEENDNSIKEKKFNYNEYISKWLPQKNNSIPFMFKASSDKRSLNDKVIKKMINDNPNIFLLGKYEDIKENNLFIDKWVETKDILDILRVISFSNETLSVDTSLVHISNFLNIKCTVYVNKKTYKLNKHIGFWLKNDLNNIQILDSKKFKGS